MKNFWKCLLEILVNDIWDMHTPPPHRWNFHSTALLNTIRFFGNSSCFVINGNSQNSQEINIKRDLRLNVCSVLKFTYYRTIKTSHKQIKIACKTSLRIAIVQKMYQSFTDRLCMTLLRITFLTIHNGIFNHT